MCRREESTSPFVSDDAGCVPDVMHSVPDDVTSVLDGTTLQWHNGLRDEGGAGRHRCGVG